MDILLGIFFTHAVVARQASGGEWEYIFWSIDVG
jgi:hypothetical protein